MKSWILFIAVLFFVLSPMSAHAIGIGVYGSYGLGSADWKDGFFSDFSTDTDHKAGGLSFDTSLSGRRVFNYHLNIGKEVMNTKDFIARNFTSAYTSDLQLSGLSMSNTFGLGGEISPGIKMWVGPELHLSWLKGSPSNVPGFKLDGAGLGFGPSLGVNFNLPSGLTLLLKAGYLVTRYSFDGEGILDSRFVSNTNYHVDENYTYLNLEIMFRTPGDR